MVDDLLEGKWPIALGMVTAEVQRCLDYIPIGQVEMVLAVPKGHELEKKASVSEHITYPYVRPDDIRETAMLFPNETSFSGRFAKSYFQQHNLSPRIICCSPMTYPLYQMVASGCGVAILPSLPLKPMEFEEQIRYLSISEPTSNFTIGLIFRKDYSLSPQEKALAELIQAEFEKG